jgi:hypothetical protein
MRFTGSAAKGSQILNAAAGPQSRMSAGTARNLPWIINRKR